MMGAPLAVLQTRAEEIPVNFQSATLPEGAIKVGATPSMTEDTVAAGLLRKHLAPRGKFGYLVVEEGALQYVWDDDPHTVLDADPEHPIVIAPERYHHVVIAGAVRFRVEFYQVPQTLADLDAPGGPREPGEGRIGERPGEDFL